LASAASILTTISSPAICTLDLSEIALNELSEPSQLTAFIDTLISPRFSSLEHLREITVQFSHGMGLKWSDTQEGNTLTVGAVEKEVSRLQSTYGDRFIDDTEWDKFYDSANMTTADEERDVGQKMNQISSFLNNGTDPSHDEASSPNRDRDGVGSGDD